MRRRLSYANVMSTIAVFLALGLGGAWAADKLKKNSVSSKQVKNESILSKDLKDGKAVAGTDVKDGSVGSDDLSDGSVGSAKVADASIGSADLTPDEAFHFVGAGDEPVIGNGVEGDCLWHPLSLAPGTLTVNPAGFYKDKNGRVHLSGTMARDNGPGGDAACNLASDAESIEDMTIFVLPPAYRPDHILLLIDGGGEGVLVQGDEVGTNPLGVTIPAGTVIGTTASGNTALDGISFRAASGPGLTSAPASQAPEPAAASDGDLPAPLGDGG